ncbi:hypothetical protein BC936DRAFT_140287 [Jimgerdemannia flammicorona]|uniref:Uncharacterized protein n=1 Tax=Jimgerdemannia flammicorona TaxID=994334 RepID=A0A433AVM3_9FUNG|nr:hypothetical protein BC936DRAFT_140287 [Jimgerdemannia flammicorona]
MVDKIKPESIAIIVVEPELSTSNPSSLLNGTTLIDWATLIIGLVAKPHHYILIFAKSTANGYGIDSHPKSWTFGISVAEYVPSYPDMTHITH